MSEAVAVAEALAALDPATREQFDAFRGRDAHPSGAGQTVLCIKQPNYPQWRFEWHPQKRKVYLVRLGNTPLIGEVICEQAETQGAAFGAVQTFLRGYKEGLTPNIAKPHLEG